MNYFLAVAGAILCWKGISGLVRGFQLDALYEDARKNRVRLLNHDGDTQ